MPSFYLKLIVIAGVTAVIGGLFSFVGYMGYRHGTMKVQAEWDASQLARRAGEEAALKAAAAAIAKIEVKSETYVQPIRTEIRTNTVYRDCLHTPDSLRNLNALILGDSAIPRSGLSASQPAP